MSQIFAPGSVAGPAGPAGAAGSLANVKSLTDSVLSNIGNLFNYTKTTAGEVIAVDGTYTADGRFSASPLIYCPGALYAITDIPIGIQNGFCYFAYYDANGNLMSTVTSFAGITPMAGRLIPANTVFPLPGTQTYIRFSIENGVYGGFGAGGYYAASAAVASFYAGVTAPSLPGTYQPFGFDTVASVNVKVAAAASATKIYDASLSRQLGGGPLGTRNAFNYRDVVLDHSVNADGTLQANAGWSVATVYAPYSTSMIANIPFYAAGGVGQVCTYDAAGNFIANINSSFSSTIDSGGRYPGGVLVSLPGNQTYIKFAYQSGWVGAAIGGGHYWGGSPRSGVFYSGTIADPPPSSLSYLNHSIPFPGNRSATVRTATELGASDDRQLDCTAILNAYLATASATNPIELILDGMFATTGLILSTAGYTTIRGLGRGTGLSLILGTPQDGIRIGPYTQVGAGNSEGLNAPTAPSRTATNICLRDFILDPHSVSGEGGQQGASTDQPYAGDIPHNTYGVILTNATEILIDNVEIKQANTYALCLSNVGFAKVTNCKMYSTGTIHDGIHIDGPSEDIGIMNCDFGSGDDAIALNAPEGYGGEISRVTVTNCRFNGSLSVMRIYTSLDPADMPANNTRSARNIVVSNCTGSIRGQCFVIGVYGGSGSCTTSVDQIQDLLVTNCTFSAYNGLMYIANTCGAVTLRGVNFIPTGTDPAIVVTYQTGKLIVDGVYILRNPHGNTAPASLIAVGAALGHLYVNNCGVIDEDGSSYTAIPSLLDLGPTVGVLELGTVDLTHVTSLMSTVNGWSHVTTARGAGVIGSGSQVPDSVMDNNTLYLSSNAGGAPSIKVGGPAKRLTLA